MREAKSTSMSFLANFRLSLSSCSFKAAVTARWSSMHAGFLEAVDIFSSALIILNDFARSHGCWVPVAAAACLMSTMIFAASIACCVSAHK